MFGHSSLSPAIQLSRGEENKPGKGKLLSSFQFMQHHQPAVKEPRKEPSHAQSAHMRACVYMRVLVCMPSCSHRELLWKNKHFNQIKDTTQTNQQERKTGSALCLERKWDLGEKRR